VLAKERDVCVLRFAADAIPNADSILFQELQAKTRGTVEGSRALPSSAKAL